MSQRSILFDWRAYVCIIGLVALNIVFSRLGWPPGFVIGLAFAVGYSLEKR